MYCEVTVDNSDCEKDGKKKKKVVCCGMNDVVLCVIKEGTRDELGVVYLVISNASECMKSTWKALKCGGVGPV